MKLKKPKDKLMLTVIILSILFVIFSFTISVFAAETKTETIDEQLEELKNILDSSFEYSDFQKNRMLLPALRELLVNGISFEDIRKIMENSVEKSLGAYNLKKIFDIILEAQQAGLPIEPLAKNAERTTIISAVSTKAKNLKKANKILSEARREGLETDDGEEIIIILANSLENDVPSDSLSWLIKKATTQGKSIKEITEISEELSYLSLMASDSGLSPEKISLLFKKSIDSSKNIEEICENIQKNLDAEISTAKIEAAGAGVKPSSTTLGDGSSPTTLTGGGSDTTSLGEIPAQEAGEAPTETSSSPEPSTSSEGSAPPPPEN